MPFSTFEKETEKKAEREKRRKKEEKKIRYGLSKKIYTTTSFIKPNHLTVVLTECAEEGEKEKRKKKNIEEKMARV